VSVALSFLETATIIFVEPTLTETAFAAIAKLFLSMATSVTK
jgi:hypothetical protein